MYESYMTQFIQLTLLRKAHFAHAQRLVFKSREVLLWTRVSGCSLATASGAQCCQT